MSLSSPACSGTSVYRGRGHEPVEHYLVAVGSSAQVTCAHLRYLRRHRPRILEQSAIRMPRTAPDIPIRDTDGNGRNPS